MHLLLRLCTWGFLGLVDLLVSPCPTLEINLYLSVHGFDTCIDLISKTENIVRESKTEMEEIKLQRAKIEKEREKERKNRQEDAY